MPFRRRHIINRLILLIALAFILLTIAVLIDPLSKIDREFSEEVQEHRHLLLDGLMRAISWAGYMPNSAILTGVAALLFFVFRYRREALFTLLTALSGVVSSLIKLAVNRPRPSAPLVEVLEKTQQQSFPSGHVNFYVVFFGFLILAMYRQTQIPKCIRVSVAILSLLLILTVPVSRVYLGAHWFSDVLGGGLLGLMGLYVLGHFYFVPNSNSGNPDRKN